MNHSNIIFHYCIIPYISIKTILDFQYVQNQGQYSDMSGLPTILQAAGIIKPVTINPIGFPCRCSNKCRHQL